MAKKRKKNTKKSRKPRKKNRKNKKTRGKVRKIKRFKNKKKRRKSKKSKRNQIFKSPYQSKDSEGNTIIKVSDSWANQAYVNDSKYKKKYKLSIKENEKFWAKEGKRISWIKKYTKIKDVKYSKSKKNCYYLGR